MYLNSNSAECAYVRENKKGHFYDIKTTAPKRFRGFDKARCRLKWSDGVFCTCYTYWTYKLTKLHCKWRINGRFAPWPITADKYLRFLSLVFTASRKHAYIILTPLNATFIKYNWGLQGHTLFFLFLLKNIDCGYSLEPPRQGGSNEYPQSMF